jgi:L-lactate dehydrogenase complex protein LldE
MNNKPSEGSTLSSDTQSYMLPKRASPAGKRVSLFITCIADMLYPQTGLSVVKLLEYLGVEIDFPTGQTCCGQPAYNTGYWTEARQVARQFIKSFQQSEVIVAPSGSCVAMVRHEFPHLFEDDPWRSAATDVATKTWEFTEYLVDGLGITDLKLEFAETRTFAFHDSCHGLRMLGLGQAARTLLGNGHNATIYELDEHDECCGFGGTFSVKMADVSGAMLHRKIDNIARCPADTIVMGDLSCIAHINGGLARVGSPKRARHIADVLAEGLVDGRPYKSLRVDR